MTKKYHDFIIDFDNRKLIKDFEGAYKNCDIVWPSQHETQSLKHRLMTADIIGTGKNSKVVDVGCGIGDYMAFLSSLGVDVCGFEVSESAVAKGKEKHGAKLRLQQGDMFEGLKVADASFDIALCLGVFAYHLDYMEKGIEELCRILKPNGILFLSVGFPENPIGTKKILSFDDFLANMRQFFVTIEVARIADHEEMVKCGKLTEVYNDLFIKATPI